MRLMLPALGTLLVLGACHKKPELTPEQAAQQDLTQFDAQVRKIVKDSSRADSLVALGHEFQTTANGMAVRDSAALKKIGALTRDYTSTRQQFDSVFSAMAGVRQQTLSQLITLRMQMSQVATEEEWQQLKSARLKMLEAELQLLEF